MRAPKTDFAKPQENNANDTPLTLALRQLHEVVTGPLFWVITLSVVVLTALAGPYFTLERFSFAERLVFWGFALISSSLIMTFLSIFAYRLNAQDQWPWGVTSALAGAVGILPVVGILYLAEGIVSGFAPGWTTWTTPASLFVSVAPTAIVVTVVVNMAIRLILVDPAERPATQSEDGTQVSQTLSVFHQKLPIHLGRDIVTIKAQDHYVEVTTTHGSAMVLARLSDAAAQLESYGCVRVHRSWLVNMAHVKRIEPAPNGPEVILTNGQHVPVGRTYRGVVDAALARHKRE